MERRIMEVLLGAAEDDGGVDAVGGAYRRSAGVGGQGGKGGKGRDREGGMYVGPA
jgi:hypothetical protein